jgi:hypothetical protein
MLTSKYYIMDLKPFAIRNMNCYGTAPYFRRSGFRNPKLLPPNARHADPLAAAPIAHGRYLTVSAIRPNHDSGRTQ